MLQPPANKILFEVSLNCCQGLNDSQEQKYVCTVCGFKSTESCKSTSTFNVCVFVSMVDIYVRGTEGDGWRKKRKRS